MSKKWFNAPVDVVGLKISSQYSATVTTPMDFGTISDKLQKGMYTSDNLFYADVVLVFENARDFSAKGATQAADVVQARLVDNLDVVLLNSVRVEELAHLPVLDARER